MTYSTGGPIQAVDYNTFASVAEAMNSIFADTNSGATTLPNAGYGYGQLPALVPVSTGDRVTAAEWGSLFSTMRKSGAHQGTVVSPPIPVGNPAPGDLIAAYNTPSSFASVITLLQANKFLLAPGQSVLTTGSSFIQPGSAKPWSSSLTFNFQVNFGSWNNARYFFNSGGKLLLNGLMTPVNPSSPTPDETRWQSMLSAMSPLNFTYASSTPSWGGGGSSIGFYGLTTSYQNVYSRSSGGGGGYYYSSNNRTVRSKLANTAGSSGLIDFAIVLSDGDSLPVVKSSTMSYRVDTVVAAGLNISYPGISTIYAVGANGGYVAT